MLRRYCFMITLSLWTRRYDVSALVLPSTILMIRSSGYGRSSLAFNESSFASNQFLKAPMEVAKNRFLF